MLKRDGFKKIVNISSNGAYNFDVFDPPHYRASKAAMDTLTKDLARRYAKEGICCNSIAPAMTETPLFDLLTEETLNKAILEYASRKTDATITDCRLGGFLDFTRWRCGEWKRHHYQSRKRRSLDLSVPLAKVLGYRYRSGAFLNSLHCDGP